MKKVISLLLAILLIVNNALAYTRIVKALGIGMVITTKEGTEVTLTPTAEEIKGWEVESGNVEITNNQFTMPGEDVTISAIEEEETYIFKLIFPYFTKQEDRKAGEVISVEALTENEDYIFKDWTVEGITITEAQKTNLIIEFTMPANAVTVIANYEEQWDGWNSPVLGTGLMPVNWNGSAWVTTTEEDWDYNYNIASASHETVEGDGTGKWANAQTSDGSLYVWIPRYTYKITSGYHSSGNSWSSVGSAGSNKIEVKFSNGTTDDTSNSYLKHPAFTFGTDELEGIWVAKYEASRNDATSSNAGSGTTVSFKPGVVAWNQISVSDMYSYAYGLNRTLDSHLMKNSEWGAVAYLTNAIGKIPYINNSSTYITGNAGGSQDASSASGVTNAWNTASGVKASSTHNVYGIYDLSGGSFEYMSAYYTGGSNSNINNLITNKDTKYVDTYSVAYDSSKNGDAVYETSSSSSGSNSWDGDNSYEPGTSGPVLMRGGYADGGSKAGIFYFYGDTGAPYSNVGFRAVLAPQENGTLTTYTVTFNANGGSGSMSDQIFYEGISQYLRTNTFTRDGYKFLGWSTDSTETTATYIDGQSYTVTGNVILYAIWEEVPWNSPVLGTGLTPVNWNGSTWVTTTEANWDYNYNIATANHGTVAGDGTAKWANAQTSDGSLYVWIPRYTYKITSGYHSSGNSWSSVDSAGSNKIEVKFSNGTTDDTSSSYKKHSAFTFGTDELKGIWVAKYEASRSNATSSSAGTDSSAYNIPTSKPGVVSWRSLSISNMYEYSYNLNRTLDSHLMKNSEWGAVAYLTNAIGKIPYINNSSSYITGNAGGSQDADYASGVTNAWNTAKGVKASTTHNIYGIYDLSGGSYEYVPSYYVEVETSGQYLYQDRSAKKYAGSLYTNRNTKYVEVYSTPCDSSKTGDAVYETTTGSMSWDGDGAYPIDSTYPIFRRGGDNSFNSYSGIFYFDGRHGGANLATSFRVVLAIP